MRRSLFTIFRAVDQDDLGVVSFAEAVKILRNVRFALSNEEVETFRSRLDLNNRGLVKF
jgi:Ca2+-binding EF-hand superfamily protein